MNRCLDLPKFSLYLGVVFAVTVLGSNSLAQSKKAAKAKQRPVSEKTRSALEPVSELPQRLPAKNPTDSESTSSAPLLTQAVELPPATRAASRSELFWQPMKNKFVISLAPLANYNAQRATLSDGQILRTDTSLIGNQFGIDYGVSDHLALRLDTTLARSESYGGSSTIVGEGLTNPRLTIKAQTDFEGQSLAYGLIGSVSPQVAQAPGLRSRGNLFTGQHSVKPYIGYQSLIGNNNIWGAYTGYEVQGPKSTWDPYDQKTLTSSGGNTLSLGAFHEWRFEKSLVGICIEHLWVEPTDVGEGVKGLPTNWFRTETYGKLLSDEKFELRPSIEYKTLPDRYRFSDRRFDQHDSFSLKLDARLNL